MKKLLLLLLFGASLIAHEIIVKESSCSVDNTMQKIESAIKARGHTVFTVIDHQKNANSVDMIMPPSKLIIFGNPRIGTNAMLSEMKVGLDLPMKILVYKDADSKVKIAYRNATWIAKKYNLSITTREAKVNKALDKVTTKAGQCIKD